MKYLFLIPLILILCSCTGSNHLSDGTSSILISDSVERVVDDTKTIKESADIIYDETEKIDQLPVPPEVKDHTSKIREETNKIISANDSIASEIGKVDVKKIENLEKKIGEYEKQDEAARLEAIKSVYGNLAFFFAVGFIMLVAGGFIVLYNKKLGGAALTIGFLTVGFASAATFYMKWIATVGIIVLVVGFLATVAMLLWALIDAKRNKIANEENIDLVQEMKGHLTPEGKDIIFNGGDGVANKIQSKKTQDIVKRIKKTKKKVKKNGKQKEPT